jgi:hypothetical protein
MPRHIRAIAVPGFALFPALGITAAAGLIAQAHPPVPIDEAPTRRSGDAGYDPCFSSPYAADVVCPVKW